MTSLPGGQLVSPGMSPIPNYYFDPSYVPATHGFVPDERVYQIGLDYQGYFVTPPSYHASVNAVGFNSSIGRTGQASNIPLHHQGTNASPFMQTVIRENLFLNLPVSQVTVPIIPRPELKIVSAALPPAVVRPMPHGHKFECKTCYRTFDRYSRLENCRNRHLGVEPHECLGRCGSPGCLKKYASIDNLDRHIEPYGICTSCGEKHLKQNMSRHRAVCAGRQ